MTTLEILKAAKAHAPTLALADTELKNKALSAMAQALDDNTASILAANALDMDAAQGRISPVMLDRLALTESRIQGFLCAVKALSLNSLGQQCHNAEERAEHYHVEQEHHNHRVVLYDLHIHNRVQFKHITLRSKIGNLFSHKIV